MASKLLRKKNNSLNVKKDIKSGNDSDSYNKKYNGPHFNSELWVKEDIKELVELINNGLKC